jgi:uncharacterized protein YndB with AHSA1/START domain
MSTTASGPSAPQRPAGEKAEKPDQAKLSLPSDREILITRDFAAKPERLFALWTEPEHVRRWYGCSTMQFSTCEIDLRAGGQWRFVLREESGTEHAYSGEYREVARPKRLVYSERYELIPGSDHVVTLTFEERAGGTRFSEHLAYPSRAVRDGHLRAMEGGMAEQFARIDELISSS